MMGKSCNPETAAEHPQDYNGKKREVDERDIPHADVVGKADLAKIRRQEEVSRSSVLVLGMHRSGTSVVTGTLTRLGLGGPASPVPANFDNPTGFYESSSIVELNDRILTALGSNYYDWAKVDPQTLGTTVLDGFVLEAAHCYRKEYGGTALAAIKDPRICRLVPLWRRALEDLAVELRVVIVFRSPVEVASSLHKRNGFSSASGLLLWLRHVLDSERHTRGLPRCFVAMDGFIDDWRRSIANISTTIQIAWPRYNEEVEAEIDSYVSKPLRHFLSSSEAISALHPWAQGVYSALRKLEADPHSQDAMAALDFFGERFDTASELFSKPTQEGYDWAHKLIDEQSLFQKQIADAEEQREQVGNALEHIRLLSTPETRRNERSDAVDTVVMQSDLPNPHFDQDWYMATYADVSESGLDPYRHYLDQGAGQGRNPSAIFDTNWYLSRYADVRESGGNPLLHFFHHGEAEGRFPGPSAVNPHFDKEWYVAQDRECSNYGIEPYNHYLNIGSIEGRDPSPTFSTNAYLAYHPDVRGSGMNPLHHYWKYGELEKRRIDRSDRNDLIARGDVFDDKFYFSHYPDVAQNCHDALDHFMTYGESEGRLPNAVFDPVFYRNVYSDVRASRGSAFDHYRTVGIQEGRLPAATERPPRNGGSRLLFIGHDSYAAGAQRVLLELIGWFQRHTLYDISVLLLGSGHLTTDYARIARTFTVNDISSEADAVRHFVGPSPDVIYCNTIVSGRAFISELSALFAKSIVIAHCHELALVIGECREPFEALCERADCWISASPATATFLRAEPTLQQRSIEVVEAFIRPTTLSAEDRSVLRANERNALGVGVDSLVVVGCGTVHWRKDPAMFVATAMAVLSRGGGLDIHFVWIGDGEDASDLRHVIEKADYVDRIHFTGHRRNAGDLVCIGDVFFLSSVEDPFPLVVLEAGQFAIPAICFDHATGMKSVVERGGRVVAERKPELAAEAILELLNDAHLRSTLGNALCDQVLSNFVVELKAPRILDVMRRTGAKPAISIIIPNYNHAPFLMNRLQSVFKQSIQDFEVVILDDASRDDSLKVIDLFMCDPRARLVVNELNSGSSFRQWQRGIALARADVIWIAESDDSCAPNFLEMLGPLMLRKDVNIAFGQTIIIDEAGTELPGALKPYLDRMTPDFGETPFIRSGAGFVNDGFGAICTIVNASGVLLRRNAVERSLPQACEFKMCGDWFVYLETMKSGSVAYEPEAINYFRRHSSSTVHRLEGSNLYFDERLRIAQYVATNFRTTPVIRKRMQAELRGEADRFRGRYDADRQLDLDGIFASTLFPDFADERVHVLFYVHGMLFSKGGIERLFSLLSSALVDRGFKISLVCSPYSRTPIPIFPLRAEVKIITADITVSAGIAKLRDVLETSDVDVFIPMLSEDLFEKVFEAADGLGIPVIASEHNNPTAIEQLWWSRERRLACFEKADAIHLVARDFETSLPEGFRSKVQVIPHALAPEFALAVRRPTEPPTIVAVGRLARQKRFDLLIKAFARLSEDFPTWHLVIYGEGEERQHLSTLIQAFDLSERIDLPGITPSIVDVLERASLFVLSSQFEATGLALLEALTAGVPTVAFADCEGNGNIICDGQNGLLAAEFTPSSLANTIRRMMTNHDLRKRCGDAARRTIADFDLDTVADLWVKLIRSQIRTRAPTEDRNHVF